MANLYNSGLTNRDTEDLGSIASHLKRLRAGYCSSYPCIKKTKKPNARYGRFITNDTSIDTCPDCKRYLFWTNS